VDLRRHRDIEQGVSRAIDGWRLGLGGVERCYGMWIYGDVHGNWMPGLQTYRDGRDCYVGVPALWRIWSASHYRNVWTSWLLYFRSADSRARQWAQATSLHYMDVGTIHCDLRQVTGRNAGDLAHCYSITPWGTPYDPFGHWIDPDAHRLRFCLTGDPYACELYTLWWNSLS
jgi:hypothetical protein